MSNPLSTLHPLNILIADISAALTVLPYLSLHKLSTSLNEFLVITRDFLATETRAQFPTAYTSLSDAIPIPPYEADIVRFTNRCRGLRKVLGLIKDMFKHSRNLAMGRPLVQALETMLSVVNQLWELYEVERWRYRRMRIASLQRLEGMVEILSELVREELLRLESATALKLDESERPKKVEVIKVVERQTEGNGTLEDSPAFYFRDWQP